MWRGGKKKKRWKGTASWFRRVAGTCVPQWNSLTDVITALNCIYVAEQTACEWVESAHPKKRRGARETGKGNYWESDKKEEDLETDEEGFVFVLLRCGKKHEIGHKPMLTLGPQWKNGPRRFSGHSNSDTLSKVSQSSRKLGSALRKLKRKRALEVEFTLNASENKSTPALLALAIVCPCHMEATEIPPRRAKQVFKTELQCLDNIKNNLETPIHQV